MHWSDGCDHDDVPWFQLQFLIQHRSRQFVYLRMSLFILIYSSVCGRHRQSELFCQELSEFSQSNYDDGGVVQKRFSRMQLQCVCVWMEMRYSENANVFALSPGWEYSSENILNGFSHLPRGIGLNVHEKCRQAFASESFLLASTSDLLLLNHN